MLTEGREGFEKVPGCRRIRSGRVSAQTEPWGYSNDDPYRSPEGHILKKLSGRVQKAMVFLMCFVGFVFPETAACFFATKWARAQVVREYQCHRLQLLWRLHCSCAIATSALTL